MLRVLEKTASLSSGRTRRRERLVIEIVLPEQEQRFGEDLFHGRERPLLQLLDDEYLKVRMQCYFHISS
jgi:hypothetical protein